MPADEFDDALFSLIGKALDSSRLTPDSSIDDVVALCTTILRNDRTLSLSPALRQMDADRMLPFVVKREMSVPNASCHHKPFLSRHLSHMLRNAPDPDALIAAFTFVPREEFMMAALRDFAYLDRPFPIGYGQAISQPTVVFAMLSYLNVMSNHKILEIGTGLGYNAALLSKLAPKGHVYTLELQPELAAAAERRLEKSGVKNVTVVKGDGCLGYHQEAPFDGIIVTAGVSLPSAAAGVWKGQLKDGGRLVVPCNNAGQDDKSFKLVVLEKTGEGFNRYFAGKNFMISPFPEPWRESDAIQLAFVPLRGAYGIK